MTNAQRLTLILSAIGIIGIPSLVLLVRLVRRWTKIEGKIDQIITGETETKKEVESRFNKVEVELAWIREKIWTLWNRWGGGRK